MKKQLLFFIIIALSNVLSAQNNNRYWSILSESNIRATGERTIIPQKYTAFQLSGNLLHDQLFAAPNEHTTSINASSTIVDLPLPDGSIEQFRVVAASIMEPSLAAQFPEIKTFNIKGITNPYANGKLDWTVFGLHGFIKTNEGTVYIDPYSRNTITEYISYYAHDFQKEPQHVAAEVGLLGNIDNQRIQNAPNAMICAGAKLRTYRLALACTGEYAVAATGKSSPTTSEILSVVTTSINRVDGIYETELAIRLVLVANETAILFGNASTDPFNGNNNASTLIGESQSVITQKIGSANFDIGHTFSTGGGGLAQLGCVCGSNKASGITGSSKPVGDPYDVDYVSHEMGHQFGGNHTFAASSGSCSGNGSSKTRVEPGSGITIMGYAGICQTNDLAKNSIAYFHAISFDEIMAYSNTGNGNSCPTTTNTTNKPPTVTIPPTTYTIPASTPFTLTGSATDPDGDSLTYSWEETDAGAQGNWNSGNKPFFRSYPPVTSSSRIFPQNNIVLGGPSGYQATKGEYLPSTDQTLNFRLTARDNKMGGGGVCYEATTVTISSKAGPFAVTYPNATNITWPGASTQTVTWDVKSTNTAPVNCTKVNIFISLDEGVTYSLVLAGTANDGTESIQVPQVPVTKTKCRLKVEAADNIFFDVSDNNFTITSTVGVNELSSNNTIGVQLIPNPAQDVLKIMLYGIQPQLQTKLIVYDILGKIIMNDQLSGKDQWNQEYSVASLPKGVYIVDIRNSEQHAVSRLVKQ